MKISWKLSERIIVIVISYIKQYYDNFDSDARNLIRLKKIYWPI